MISSFFFFFTENILLAFCIETGIYLPGRMIPSYFCWNQHMAFSLLILCLALMQPVLRFLSSAETWPTSTIQTSRTQIPMFGSYLIPRLRCSGSPNQSFQYLKSNFFVICTLTPSELSPRFLLPQPHGLCSGQQYFHFS